MGAGWGRFAMRAAPVYIHGLVRCEVEAVCWDDLPEKKLEAGNYLRESSVNIP
jgi:hypothetical protein